MKKYIVLTEFADKDNLSNHYVPGDELPGTFGEDRLANIVSRGLAKVEDAEAGNGKGKGKGNDTGTGNTVTDIDLTANTATIISQLKGNEEKGATTTNKTGQNNTDIIRTVKITGQPIRTVGVIFLVLSL
jgi:hypothetical protein